jgi:hypothetical protein
VRHLVLRLIVATAAATVAAVTAAAMVVHLIGERDRLHRAAEADLVAIVNLAEATSDLEALRRGLARTAAGREGRLAVHVAGATVGRSRLGPAVDPPARVVVEDGTVLVRDAGLAVVEVFVPDRTPGTREVGLAALLLGTGALVAGVGAALAARRLQPRDRPRDRQPLSGPARHEVGADARRSGVEPVGEVRG